jgi:hypothetical protein
MAYYLYFLDLPGSAQLAVTHNLSDGVELGLIQVLLATKPFHAPTEVMLRDGHNGTKTHFRP